MFLLQKLLSRLLFPVPLTLIALAVGLAAVILARWTRRPRAVFRTGLALVGAGGAFLLLAASPPVADAFLWSLERRYAPVEELPRDVSYIAVLGSGHSEREGLSAWHRLGRSAHARVGEAVRLARGNEATVVFSGYEGAGETATARVARDAAVELGLDPDRTRVLPEPRNTAEEAKALARFLEGAGEAAAAGAGGAAADAPVVLVTSASHMHRALYFAERAGLRVRPAPTDYRAVPARRSLWGFFPSAGALSNTERAWYEYMGLVWARIRYDKTGDSLRDE